MAYLPAFRFSFALFTGIALFSGCCANNVCDCNDAQADAIKIRFARSQSATDMVGFTPGDLDTLIVQRYPKDLNTTNFRSVTPETVTLFRTADRAYDSLVINNATPFPQSGTNRIDQYKYVVRYNDPRRAQRLRPRSVPALIIDKVELNGSFEANGCCTCYTNLQKTVTFRQDSTVAPSAAVIIDLKNPSAVLTVDKSKK
jgi:hypothetical protein